MNTFYIIEDGKPKSVQADEVFPFIKEKKHQISLVGAGGKTTLMYVLARQASKFLDKILIFTTTHIQKPEDTLFAKDLQMLENLWSHQKIAVIGELEVNAETQIAKLISPQKSLLTYAKNMADICFIEADGAKRLPIKAPAAHEPVIFKESDIVIGVIGISCYGKKIKDICFRNNEAAGILGTGIDTCLEAKQIAEILLSDQGTRKFVDNREYYIVINQCDTQADIATAMQIQRKLQEQGFTKVIITGTT